MPLFGHGSLVVRTPSNNSGRKKILSNKQVLAKGMSLVLEKREQTLISLKCNWVKTKKEFWTHNQLLQNFKWESRGKTRKAMDVKHVGDAWEQQIIFIDT
jgi:hypothetical protein